MRTLYPTTFPNISNYCMPGKGESLVKDCPETQNSAYYLLKRCALCTLQSTFHLLQYSYKACLI